MITGAIVLMLRLVQIRIWSRPEVFDQTEYALQLAASAYRFYADYFERPEIVTKAGTQCIIQLVASHGRLHNCH